MTEYKKNHTVPAFMLKYWVDENTPFKGVHIYDIKSQRPYVSTSKGKKPFSFAIINNLYTHDGYGRRSINLEKWFSEQEGSLSHFIRLANNREPIQVASSFDLTKIVMGLISLEYRSNYVINKIMEELKTNINVRNKISANPERPIEQLVLENIVHAVTEQYSDFIPTEMIFFFAPQNYNWVISDRPYLYHNSFEYHFVVLTNKTIIGYRRAPAFVYNFVDMNEEGFEEINKMFALNAREWLVTKTSNELDKYSVLYKTSEWTAGMENDKPHYRKIKNLSSGYTIDS